MFSFKFLGVDFALGGEGGGGGGGGAARGVAVGGGGPVGVGVVGVLQVRQMNVGL